MMNPAPVKESLFGGAPDLVHVASFDNVSLAHDRALVILAMGLPYWSAYDGEVIHLFVESGHVQAVARELESYEQEQAEWKPTADLAGAEEEAADGFYGPYTYVLVLILAFILQNHYGTPWVERGRFDAGAMVEKGQWWRAVTALFLHGDTPHLLGNLVIGVWYGSLVTRYLGALGGWLAIFASGVIGNVLLAFFYHPEPHHAIGASTAVFGALGLLVSGGLLEARRKPWQHHRRRWLPLVAGVVVLLWTGGFGRTGVDALAHVFGFLGGILLGLLLVVLAKMFVRDTRSLRTSSRKS